MATDIKIYKVPRAIAQRAGVLGIRYRTKDGMFILDNKDLRRVRMTSEEIENGLQGIVRITPEESTRLQIENNFRMGDDGIEFDIMPEDVSTEQQESAEPPVTDNTEVADEPEAIDGEEGSVISEDEGEPQEETTEGRNEPEETTEGRNEPEETEEGTNNENTEE